MYSLILRPLFFLIDPETIHHLFLDVAKFFRIKFLRDALRSFYRLEDARLSNSVFGIDFKNPIGLAAGFDKNCEALEIFTALGFGFVELGTITAQAQPGNPRPRIARLCKDRALINRMGFPSKGADVVCDNLRQIDADTRKTVLAINIGKTKVVPIDDALQDYLQSFTKLYNFGDFFVLNVSSPNTPELRQLQERSRLMALFRGVQEINVNKKPLLVKIAPDLSFAEIDDILECCRECNISGIVATNTTFSREGLTSQTDQQGGLSGAPLFKRALEIVKYIAIKSERKIPIIAVGGVFSVEDVIAMMESGASLVQIYTYSLIYEGPSLVYRLNKQLLHYLQMQGLNSVKELVGSKVRA